MSDTPSPAPDPQQAVIDLLTEIRDGVLTEIRDELRILRMEHQIKFGVLRIKDKLRDGILSEDKIDLESLDEFGDLKDFERICLRNRVLLGAGRESIARIDKVLTQVQREIAEIREEFALKRMELVNAGAESQHSS